MSSYVDADPILNAFREWINGECSQETKDILTRAIRKIEEAPSVDIVKCKDCDNHTDKHYCPMMDSLTEDTFYCGWGRL